MDRTATITVTSQALIGKRIYLLYTVENDEEILLDAKVAETMPKANGDEFYCPVGAMELSGIFNGRSQATLTFNEFGKLVNLQ